MEGKGHGSEAGPVRLQTLLWFSFFAVSSVSMVLLNKYCIMLVPQPYSMLGFQNTMTIILNLIGVQVGIFKIQSFKVAQFKMFFLPTFLFVGMLATSLIALPYVSIATTVIFRAVSTCLVAVGDFLFFGRKFSTAEVVCLLFVVAGAFVYSAGDISFDKTGYMWMAINSLMFSSSQLYEKYAVVSLDQSAVGISCVQNMMSLPIILAMGIIMNETPAISLEKATNFTRIAVLLTGFCGCALSVCYMSLTKFASATSISLAGNFNKLVSIVAGAFVFNNPLRLMQVFGLLISMTATMAFSQNGKLPFDFHHLLMRRQNQGILVFICVLGWLSMSQLEAYANVLDRPNRLPSLLEWRRRTPASADRQQSKVAELVRQISDANERIAHYSATLARATAELAAFAANGPPAATIDSKTPVHNASAESSGIREAKGDADRLAQLPLVRRDTEPLNSTLVDSQLGQTSPAGASAVAPTRQSTRSSARALNRSELSVESNDAGKKAANAS